MVRDDGTIVRQGGPPARKKCRRVRATAELRGSARSVKTGADIMMVVCKSDWVDEV